MSLFSKKYNRRKCADVRMCGFFRLNFLYEYEPFK
jgi:hypothetical protein